MNDFNLPDLIDDMKSDNGERINALIKRGIITADQVADQVIESKNIEYIFLVANYIIGAPINKLARAFIDIENCDNVTFKR